MASADADAFQCVVCLDILYKPIVLACGHTYCFWCGHKAMHGILESNCAVCRQPYNYFPSICQLLHVLLKKIEPVAYKQREKEILDEEKNIDAFSPQFLEGTLEGTVAETNNIDGDASCSHSRDDEVCISDVLCVRCNEVLFLPSVLNCGHVYCGSCMATMGGENIKCHLCQSRHPGKPPKSCFVLDHFLKLHFPKEYARREDIFQLENKTAEWGEATSSASAAKITRKPVLQIKNGVLYLFGDVPNIHMGVGCDSCGMCPIIGKRYKCKDCRERVGFDLCEECYTSSSKLPGRFNQQHTPDHVLILDDTKLLINHI